MDKNDSNQGIATSMREIILLPGPVSLSQGVKESLMKECSPWGDEFQAITRSLGNELLRIAGVAENNLKDYVTVFNQGCGSFMIEAIASTLISRTGGKTLVVCNGIYGERMVEVLKRIGRDHVAVDIGFWKATSSELIEQYLSQDPDIEYVWTVHCETTSGLVNPIREISEVVRGRGRKLFVDSVASFGCLDQEIESWGALAVFSTSNKCLEGAPGFAFACINRDYLETCQGNASSLGFDLYSQYQGFESSGNWRYTPPVNVVMSFARAIEEFNDEGGAVARRERYSQNMRVLLDGMDSLGFDSIVPRYRQSPVIATFLQPCDKNFDRERFNGLLKDRGFVIYPNWQTADVPSIRVATIGACVTSEVMERFIASVEFALMEMRVSSCGGMEEFLSLREE